MASIPGERFAALSADPTLSLSEGELPARPMTLPAARQSEGFPLPAERLPMRITNVCRSRTMAGQELVLAGVRQLAFETFEPKS
jgi:hypothetical protein